MAPAKRKAALEADLQRKRLQSSVAHTDADLDIADSHLPSSSPVPSNGFDSSDDSYLEGNEKQSAIVSAATPVSTTAVESVKAKSKSRYPSDRKIHRCPFDNCVKAFNRPARLQEHLRSHNNERIFQCPHEGCDKSFIRASHLNHHVKSAHTTIRDYVCPRPECGKSFVTGTRLRRHLTAHEGRDKYRCTGFEGCDETFRKHSTLQRHIMSVHLGLKPFPCEKEGCSAGFETAGHLRVHVARMHGEPRFTCTECRPAGDAAVAGDITTGENQPQAPVSFPTYALLQNHLRTAHPPVCNTCGQICTTSRELRRHVDVAHGLLFNGYADGSQSGSQGKELFQCPIASCGRNFSKKGNLNVHIRTVHEGEKRFACGETDLSNSRRVEGYDRLVHGCGKRYGSKLALEEHVRTAHLGLKTAKQERNGRNVDPSQSQQTGAPIGVKAEASSTYNPSFETNSDVALLTGADSATSEKLDGRHIPCLLSDCLYRFHRDYDLWLHMNTRHGLGEGVIQWLFMRRAMSGAYESFDLNTEDLYSDQSQGFGPGTGFDGLEVAPDLSLNLFDTFSPSFDATSTPENLLSQTAVVDSHNISLFDGISESADRTNSALVDPGLSYTFDG